MIATGFSRIAESDLLVTPALKEPGPKWVKMESGEKKKERETGQLALSTCHRCASSRLNRCSRASRVPSAFRRAPGPGREAAREDPAMEATRTTARTERLDKDESVFRKLYRSRSFLRGEERTRELSVTPEAPKHPVKEGALRQIVREKLSRSRSFLRNDEKTKESSITPEPAKEVKEGALKQIVREKLRRSRSFRSEEKSEETSPSGVFRQGLIKLRDKSEGGRSVLDRLCRSGSFRVTDDKAVVTPTKKLSIWNDKVKNTDGGLSVLNKICRSNRGKDDKSDTPVRRLSSRSFSGKERPNIEKRLTLRRSGSFNECDKDGGCATSKTMLTDRNVRSPNTTRVPSAQALPKKEGSLQATVFAPRVTAKSERPATVLLVYPSGTGLERVGPMRPLSSDLNPPRIDTYRFSMANLEDSQDVDLDAILGELCALESQYDEALAATPVKQETEIVHRRSMSDTGQTAGSVHRTDSPDNDSAFSDSVSLLSSESSASSGRTDTHSQADSGNGGGKAEKIRLALQKMKEASVKKLFIKVFSADGSAKSLLVDETMSCGYVTRVLADKNHQPMQPQWALMEHLPDLHLERVYEDHESLVDNLMIWTRDSKNRLLFVKRPERTLLFEQPELLSGPNSTTRGDNVDECSRNNMIEELFSGTCVPSMEGPLYVKSDSKKGWKRHHCVLRASGLYCLPKDKVKLGSAHRDLVCLATFDVNQVYYGVGWRKKLKAPTEYGFALKHPSLQQPKSCKYIKFLCADDQTTLHQWVLAIRMAKYGRQLLVNYRSVLEECRLPSCERVMDTTVRHSTISATSSLLDTASESGSSGCDVGFECDFPSGTIKRKPPKIPLTATTRQLKDIAVGDRTLKKERTVSFDLDRAPSLESLPPPPPEVLENFVHTDEELPPPPPPPRLAPPSTAFLQDLQRVMRRKWQVAQKCKQDTTTTPHEVLGFRDPPDYRETNVSNWVEEHYGGQNLYENVYRPGSIQIAPGIQIAPVKKRPPPPPPPRAETTQLSNRHSQKC